ncbi:hypothetical protein B296_00031054 [Ensete ventricosum]|uniref:Uncharacterized protein n=1 Tax=Ensete ventricosum TaxID=4639 RepID=A0A427AH75_ENSVE|nr:hypothetical protein B296_00031054 [Ensete ventricosum]
MKYDYLYQYLAVALSRRTLAAVSAVLVAGGTVAYMQSHRCRRIPKSEESSSRTTSRENGESSSRNGVSDPPVRVARPGRKGLRSLHVLAAILLSRMGANGIWNLMALVTTAKKEEEEKKNTTRRPHPQAVAAREPFASCRLPRVAHELLSLAGFSRTGRKIEATLSPVGFSRTGRKIEATFAISYHTGVSISCRYGTYRAVLSIPTHSY